MSVLIPLLLRPDGPECWKENATDIAKNLTYPEKEVIIFDEAVQHTRVPTLLKPIAETLW